MKVITPGHKYDLDNFENDDSQRIQFIQKSAFNTQGELRTVSDGTTNEEVLLMLIDRMEFLNRLIPCRETSIAITKVQEALLWLNHRTVDRRERGVEGTHLE